MQLSGQKQRALLALLLLDANRVVSTDRIIDALWGEQPPRTAVTSLQNFVSQLRKLLGAEMLLTKPPGYRLEIAPEQLDLERFRRLVDSARKEPAEDRAAKLQQALALWRGPPLADLGFEGFAQPEIARLEELRLAVLEDRLEAELEAGRHGEIVGELETLTDEQPLRERLRGHLMLALYRSGRQAEALDVGTPRAETRADRLGDVAATLLAGRLVPVLGADVAELTTRLAERFEYPANGDTLPRVAQYIAVMNGSGPLYDELHTLLETGLPPTAVHRFFASLPPLLRERGVPHQLIVTTSYDLALERAFLDAGEEFDVVSYLAAGRNRGKFCH